MFSNRKKLLTNYKILLKHFGRQHWWPGDTRWEIMVGAVLTQNTAWSNVEKAINNLKKADSLNYREFIKLPKNKLSRYIRSAGYFNQKASYLKNISGYIERHYKGNLKKLFSGELKSIREELLSIKGIGSETADSMLLYAGNKQIFVIDAYTKRITSRWGIKNNGSYTDLQRIFQENLPGDTRLYNEYHALLVALGKNYCKTRPDCAHCPLRKN